MLLVIFSFRLALLDVSGQTVGSWTDALMTVLAFCCLLSFAVPPSLETVPDGFLLSSSL